jgi:hypothetical protein
MKIQHTLTWALCALVSLASCEMKDEIFDKNQITGDVGYLNLAVSAQNKVTKAATDEGTSTNSSVSVDNFEVEISNSEGVYKQFDSYTELQEAGKITLPVGEYTINAHTSGDIAPKMDYPYYNGEESLKITKDTETSAKVICTMQNTKIQLNYGETFATVYKSWNITISDGSDNILTYDETNLNPAATYWLIADNVSAIKVHIEAYLQDGTKITEDRSITKPDDAESNYWSGSDALTITMEPGNPTVPDDPNGATINIKVEVSFSDSEVTEEIPVEGGDDGGEEGGEPTDPDEGEAGSGEPTISSQYLTSGISYTITANPEANESDPTSIYIMSGNPQNAEVVITADAGFKEINVKITTNNSGFGSAIGAIGLNQSVNILEEGLNEMLVQVLDPPSVGDTNYTLDIATFFGMMNMYGPGVHTFDISVIDANDKKASASLTVTITLGE